MQRAPATGKHLNEMHCFARVGKTRFKDEIYLQLSTRRASHLSTPVDEMHESGGRKI